LPLFCKFIFTSCTALYLVSFLLPQPLYLVALTPSLVISQYHVWRLITAPFYNPQLLMLLFGLWSYMPRAGPHEKTEGTVRMAMEFLIYTLIISLLFCLTGFILGSSASPGFYLAPQMGLWPLVMCEMVVDCNRDPDVARYLCCLPIQIKSKYFPWIFLLIFFLLAPEASLSLVVGFAVGYLQIYGMLDRFRPKESRVRDWEKKFPFKSWNQHKNFVAAGGSGSDIPVFVRSNPPGQPGSDQQDPGSNSAFSAFGGAGVRLGDANAGSRSSSSSSSAMDRIR